MPLLDFLLNQEIHGETTHDSGHGVDVDAGQNGTTVRAEAFQDVLPRLVLVDTTCMTNLGKLCTTSTRLPQRCHTRLRLDGA